MSQTTKPAQGHVLWTPAALPSQVLDPGSKKTTGWVADDIPPFEFQNWIEWTFDLWDQYFEYITDLHTTQITALQASVISLGSASNVSASNTGHTTLTGTTVQAQLDETDAALKDLYDTVTSGLGIDLVGYDPSAPGNWTPSVPTHAGPAIDQLALRVKSLEAASAGQDFVQQTFNDYVLPGDKAYTGNPTGVGNPGLTSNSTTNPRNLNISELQTKWGEERLWFQKLVLTGNFDSAGRPEWSLGAQRHDKRVLFYGNWYTSDSAVGNAYNDALTVNGTLVRNQTSGDYFTVTAVCDSIGLISRFATTESDQIDVQVDGVSTGIPLSQRGFSGTVVETGSDQIVSDVSLIALGYGFHTFKFTNGASDSSLFWDLYGITLITTGQKQMGGAIYLDKLLTTFNASAITAPTVGNKGAKVVRYVDPADSTIKDAISNVLNPTSTVTGTVGSGATSLSVASATGFVANSLALIYDSPTNRELVFVNSVNTGLNQLAFASPGTVNSYTNPTVIMYGKVFSATNHSNEKKDAFRPFNSLGINQIEDTSINSYNTQGTGAGYGQILGVTKDGARGVIANNSFHLLEDRFLQVYSGNTAGDFMFIQFKGTGLDMLFAGLTGAGAGTSQYDFVLDGVPLPRQTFTYTDPDTPQWKKICSDLPEGSHTLELINVNSTSDVVQPVLILEYTEADPAAILNLDRGDILSSRYVPGAYFFNPDVHFPSMGVLQNQINRNACWSNFTTPGAAGWAIGGGTLNLSCAYQTATTNDYMKKWFYGTGVELAFIMQNNDGIAELKVDGNLLTPSNFPSALVQVSGGAVFTPTTGLLDCYTAAVSGNTGKFSVSNLVEGWHMIQVRVTGTRNGSSSANNVQICSAWLIGHPYSDSVFNHGNQGTDSVDNGGVKDLRIMDSYNLADRNAQICDLNVSCYNSGTLPGGVQWNMPGMSAMVETFGGDLEIEGNIGAGSNGQATMFLYVDGRCFSEEAASAANNYMKIPLTFRMPLPAGKHFVAVRLSTPSAFSSVGNHFKIKEISNRNF